MEKAKRKNRRGNKAPKVPICTYRWEDLRRAKRKGGYPWTYLYKSPFNENLDPEPFTMEAMRRSKSSSTMGKPENTVEITELTSESRKNSFNPLVTEPEDHSIQKEAPSSSVLIIECPTEVDNSKQEVLESAESSDNVSQYLDKEEKNLEEVKTSEDPKNERAKSEETQNRKRKLSAESSYSRISLSKLAVIKKLRDAKKKMKVPKISFPASKFKKPAIPTKKQSPPETKKITTTKTKSPKTATEKPVYIHIPLKPPPGKTDEFSYLEFGEKKPEEKKKELKINPAFKGLLKSVRELGEKEKTAEAPPLEPSNEKLKEDEEEIVEKMETEETKEESTPKEEAKDIPEEPKQPEEKPEESTEEEDVFERFFKKPQPAVVEQLQKPPDPRQVRSKSAEPERKRKGSLESSYSRKSLSKLAFIKRLKEASDRVKSTLTRSGSSKKEQKKKPQEKFKEFVSTPAQKKQPTKPVYIHIPLRPPEGQTDEFSYLGFEEKKKIESPILEESSPEILTPTKPHDVQLIFLTPPSDDEILDDKLDIPDTPSSENSKFFGGKIEELKALAQQVVDEVSSETKKNTLEPVKEESPNGSNEELKENNGNKMLVDEEDGLNEAPKSEKVVKKKVSFRRRSKTPKDDGEYEPIEAPKEEQIKAKPKLEGITTNQSMSTDEEKTYLDQKIMKETSLEEDYNKWSKLSDHDNHEYEPINPPEEVTFAVAPTVTVTDTEKFKDFIEAEDSNRVLPSTTELKNSELKLDKRIERAEPRTSAQSSEASKKSESEKVLEEETSQASKVPQSSSGKFQMALKQKTDQLKSKLHNIKKPHITLPKKPTFQKPHIHKPDFKRFKLEKPNIHLPKIPDTAKINLPSFTLPKRIKKSKRVIKTRSASTESNAGDSNESKKPLFDFSTYPRLFQRKAKVEKTSEELPSYATAPRNKKKEEKDDDRWGGSDTIRVPLHPEESVDDELNLEEQEIEEDEKDREDSVERRMKEASRVQYEDDIDTDDAYARENDEINKAEAERRWQRGSFRSKDERRQVTDLDSPEDLQVTSSVDNVTKRYSSDDFIPKPGVMEEIGSDEFVIRQKGISQEDIDFRKYLTSEIREAFRTPSQTPGEDAYRDYPTGSIQSLPETPVKKKSIKKPKRKKTPHHSQEQLPYDEESVDEFATLPPSRPKRRSKRVKKPKDEENVIPYQETIHVDDRLALARESLGILGDDEREEIELLYENEKMQGKEQPDIKVSRYQPEAPPRKHRSLKSLNFSENDSILGFSTIAPDRDYPQTSVPARSRTSSSGSNEIPAKPARTRSRTSLGSREPQEEEPPQRPSRQRSRTDESVEPCIEEPCIQDIRDYMGYAIVDKSKPAREPPLPPPRTPPRRRSTKSTTPADLKFSTVPRTSNEPPVRPLRNYSTLAQVSRTREEPRYENKENIDISQYIEIEEPNVDLHSGDVIQKMRERPLPAPPRPPRKSKQGLRKSLQDITSRENIFRESTTQKEDILEENVSTQTEPLPDDFVCEELVQEPTDTVITPRVKRSLLEEPTVKIERHLITPTSYTHEETVTHASLIVEPLEGARILPDSQLTKSNERIVPVSREESDEEETSVVPEEFKKLKDVEVLKTQKLQVADLDVDKLSVNQLLANKIIVSEIDSTNIQTGEISSKSGPLRVSEIELPPGLVQELIRNIKSEVQAQAEEAVQKKTPMKQVFSSPESPVGSERSEVELMPPLPPPRGVESSLAVSGSRPEVVESSSEEITSKEDEKSPKRPPRQARREEEGAPGGETRLSAVEPEVDDEPPPRPPQPSPDYIPSQPPASFYALRAQKFVDDNIPVVPRRRRRARSRRSRSTTPDSSGEARRRSHRRPSDPSVPQLTGRLVRACGARANEALRRLIKHLVKNVLDNQDGTQDAQVMIIILLVLVAGLILLGYGEGKTVVHLHHWEYFNPPGGV